MSLITRLSELPSSQSTEGESPKPAPTPKWKIWSRGINKKGDWNCTHRFTDKTENFHYVNTNGNHYMRHRDGSGTLVTPEGRYIPCRRDPKVPDLGLPAPTMEEIIEEHEMMKKEYRQYLVHPVKYWKGVRSPPLITASSFFSTCDCGDRFLGCNDDYLGYEDAYEDEDEDDGRDSEDEEDYSDDDRRSSSPDERKPTIKQEDDKTTARIADGVYPPAVEEAKGDVKQEIKEEIRDGVVTWRPTTPKPKEEHSVDSAPPTAPEPIATGSSPEITSRGSEIGPNVETEGKRILRSHRSKPY